jgi:hypothetical protein
MSTVKDKKQYCCANRGDTNIQVRSDALTDSSYTYTTPRTMGIVYDEELDGFWHGFAPQEPVELEADEVVDDVESLVPEPPPPPPGGVRSTTRLGTAISITLSIIPNAAERGIRGPSRLTLFAAS